MYRLVVSNFQDLCNLKGVLLLLHLQFRFRTMSLWQWSIEKRRYIQMLQNIATRGMRDPLFLDAWILTVLSCFVVEGSSCWPATEKFEIWKTWKRCRAWWGTTTSEERNSKTERGDDSSLYLSDFKWRDLSLSSGKMEKTRREKVLEEEVSLQNCDILYFPVAGLNPALGGGHSQDTMSRRTLESQFYHQITPGVCISARRPSSIISPNKADFRTI